MAFSGYLALSNQLPTFLGIPAYIDSTFSDKTKMINHRAFELGVLEKTRAKLRQNNIEIDKYIEEMDKKLSK